MKNLNVLFLGWDFSPFDEEQGTNCYKVATEMANQLKVSLILPRADLNVKAENINLIGLNNHTLTSAFANSHFLKVLPFAEADYIRALIPLYGSIDIPENQRSYSRENKAGSFSGEPDNLPKKSTSSSNQEESTRVFDLPNWDNISTNTKIIQYARYAARYAINQAFDLIFAHNWLTYLAGSELKLITGKPLAIQIDSLCQERREVNNQGWMYELEKSVIERADVIFTFNPAHAAIIKSVYQVFPASIFLVSESSKNVEESFHSFHLSVTNEAPTNMNNTEENTISEKSNSHGEVRTNKIVELLTKMYPPISS
ncbi:hypothetical protein AHMF7605_03520 [Adhaeribacter arboris]|uniref:Glycosyltransferase family 1 protein n=1 Tax=Adhaeribacter arboris TaxID=2072846 RepID=A0A2T2YB38_9BACT|nr:hypothetical protein [Adhaeribacter arboris]PSR52658.1 hypothetical protein AHMF7605_03520 [Adhaeribacter arboris]